MKTEKSNNRTNQENLSSQENRTNQENLSSQTEAQAFTFDDLAFLAEASAALRFDPEDLEAQIGFSVYLEDLLELKSGEHPTLSWKELFWLLADEADERTALVNAYLEALIEEPEEWESHWEETRFDLDWEEEVEALEFELSANAELFKRFRELAEAC